MSERNQCNVHVAGKMQWATLQIAHKDNPKDAIMYHVMRRKSWFRREKHYYVVADNTGYTAASKYTRDFPDMALVFLRINDVYARATGGEPCTIEEVNRYFPSGIVVYDTKAKKWVNTDPEFAWQQYDDKGALDVDHYLEHKRE